VRSSLGNLLSNGLETASNAFFPFGMRTPLNLKRLREHGLSVCHRNPCSNKPNLRKENHTRSHRYNQTTHDLRIRYTAGTCIT